MPTRKLCKTCQYWTAHNNNPVRGNCASTAFVYDGMEDCPPETKHDTLHYWDYESYQAGFDTGANFGCIHWIKKRN